jgi:hypothetical protein
MIYVDYYFGSYQEVSDISNPENIHLLESNVTGYYFSEAKGDTFSTSYSTIMFSWHIEFDSFAPNDTSHFPFWHRGPSYWPPANFIGGQNGFAIAAWYGRPTEFYSYENFTFLGMGGIPSQYLNITFNNHLIVASSESLHIFQPTYDTTTMPQIAALGQSHLGILSTASYGNYVLSGAESNGGELLVHELGQSGQLSLVATVPGVPARRIFIVGTTAFCLSPNAIAAIGLSNPHVPQILHQYTLAADLADLAVRDSVVIICGPTRYAILDYDAAAGFSLLYQPSGPTAPQHSLVRDSLHFYVLVDADAYELAIFDISDPRAPNLAHQMYSIHEFQNLEIIHGKLWASGLHGTVIYNTSGKFDSVGFYTLEYFSDLHDAYASGDTLYVADGANGLKVFTFQGDPTSGLHYAGDYQTGNMVNQISTINNNFFLTDYYSLHHLRWGAPTGMPSENETGLPSDNGLLGNYPNPFNAQTIISYSLPADFVGAIAIYDIAGRLVRTMDLAPGSSNVTWDGANALGRPVASGVYFYALSGHPETTRKMVLLR